MASDATESCYMFSVPDDTQVYSADGEKHFFAFTHHLTLFDIHARGYVHPVALSYISRDPEKILLRFEEFMDKFKEVSRLMKIGNFSNFALDLKHRFLDLEYTKFILQQDTHPTCQEAQKSHMSIEAVQQAMASTRLMMDTIESCALQLALEEESGEDKPLEEKTDSIAASPESHRKEGTDSLQEEDSQEQQQEKEDDYKPRYVETLHPIPHFERRLRTLAQLCQEPDQSYTTKKGKHRSLPQITVIPLVSIITPQFTTSSKQRRSFACAITHDMYSEALGYMTKIVSDMGRSSVALDIEEDQLDSLCPSASAISMGGLFVLNLKNPAPRVLTQSPGYPKPIDSYFVHPSLAMDDPQPIVAFHRERKQRREDPDYFSIQLESSYLWNSKEEEMSGQRLLEVCRTFRHAIHHVLFSLMTGRPVVIIGRLENKSHVQEVVEALRMFVPGHSKQHHRVENWFVTTRLTDKHLQSMKLVGTDKDNLDASVYCLDISCLDIDAVSQNQRGHLITSPLYLDGQWISQLLDQVDHYYTDAAYLAYIHTVFMSIALKVYVYHHMYVAQHATPDEEQSPGPSEPTTPQSKEDLPSDSDHDLSRKWSVRRIMNYLKRIEERESQSELNPSFSSLHRHILNQFTVTQEAEEEQEKSLSDENEATVTLHSFQVEHRPTLADMNWFPHHSTKSRQSLSGSCSDSSASECGKQSFERPGALAGARSSDEEDSSSDEERQERGQNSRQRRSSRQSLQSEDEYMEGLLLNEKRGRRFLHDKLRVYGDDQTIVVYLANLGTDLISVE